MLHSASIIQQKTRNMIGKSYLNHKAFVILDSIVPILGILIITILVLESVFRTLNFDQYPYDGPFQHIYPLREIDHGYYPGIDFHFFHGTLIPYITYLPYRMLGGGIFGAILSAKILQLVTITFGTLFLSIKLAGYRWGCLICTIVIYLSQQNTILVGLSPSWDVSSFGIRTFMGLIIAALFATKFKNQNYQSAIIGVLSAMGVFFGTEQGFYYFVASIGTIMMSDNKAIKKTELNILLSSIFILSLVMFPLIAWRKIDALLYVKNVMADQVWYYGAPPVLFIRNISEILHDQNFSCIFNALVMFLIIFIILIYLRRYKILEERKYRALMFLELWGIVATTSNSSIVAYHYIEPLIRNSIISILYIGILINSKIWVYIVDVVFKKYEPLINNNEKIHKAIVLTKRFLKLNHFSTRL